MLLLVQSWLRTSGATDNSGRTSSELHRQRTAEAGMRPTSNCTRFHVHHRKRMSRGSWCMPRLCRPQHQSSDEDAQHRACGCCPIRELGCTLWSPTFLKACRGPSSSPPITPRRRNAGAAGLRCVWAAAIWSRPPAVQRQMGLSIVRPARRGGCAWQAARKQLEVQSQLLTS